MDWLLFFTILHRPPYHFFFEPHASSAILQPLLESVIWSALTWISIKFGCHFCIMTRAWGRTYFRLFVSKICPATFSFWFRRFGLSYLRQCLYNLTFTTFRLFLPRPRLCFRTYICSKPFSLFFCVLPSPSFLVFLNHLRSFSSSFSEFRFSPTSTRVSRNVFSLPSF